MNVQKLGDPFKTRTEAEKRLLLLFPHATKVSTNKWRNGSSQIWIDTNNQIVINYGRK